MRLSFRFLLFLIPVLAGVAFLFNSIMDRLEKDWALKDLYDKAAVIHLSIHEPVFEAITSGQFNRLHRIYKRISTEDKNLKGLLICTRDGKAISRSGRFPKEVTCEWDHDGDPTPSKALRDSGLLSGQTLHRSWFLLEDDNDLPRGYLAYIQDSTYLSARSELARRYAMYAFLILGIVISFLTVFLHRWSLSRPAEQITEVLKGVLTGDAEKVSKVLESGDFKPYVRDLDEVLVGMRRGKNPTINGKKGAQPDAADEFENLWSPDRLNEKVQDLFEDSKICVIADEEPYIHTRRSGSVDAVTPASGMVTSVEPILKSCSGLWIGRGTGNADHQTADKKGLLLVPPGKPEYALKRVWLSKEEEEGFYFGMSNEGIWPLCHIAHERPSFRQEDWQQFVEVNAKFASAFNEEENGARPIVLIQNYHFSLVPSMLRKMRPDALTCLFWHIPWPSSEKMRILPWRKDLLMGMLGADLIGFQTQAYCNAFLNSVDRFLEARVSRNQFSVTIQGHTCYVKPFPTGVVWPAKPALPADEFSENRKQILDELGLGQEVVLGLSVDRLDYTKGIVERLHAIERLLEQNPNLVGKFVFVQLVAPTDRLHLKRYQELNSQIQTIVDRINWRFYTDTYKPIILKMAHHSKEMIFRYYRATDFLSVGSIHDGMNMVAKEFVSSRSDRNGILILSHFTGASLSLKDALLMNPYDVEESAAVMKQAIEMSREERVSRMSKMRKVVAEKNAFYWASELFGELYAISERKLQDQTDETST